MIIDNLTDISIYSLVERSVIRLMLAGCGCVWVNHSIKWTFQLYWSIYIRKEVIQHDCDLRMFIVWVYALWAALISALEMSKYSHVSLIHWNQATISQYKLKWIRHAECKMAPRYQQQKNWPCWLVSLSEYFENCCPKISYKWMSKGYLWVFALSDLFC